MTLILRLLLLSTPFVSCLPAPKFHLIETEDDGGAGAPDEADPPPMGSSQEDNSEDRKGGADNWPTTSYYWTTGRPGGRPGDPLDALHVFG